MFPHSTCSSVQIWYEPSMSIQIVFVIVLVNPCVLKKSFTAWQLAAAFGPDLNLIYN